MSWTWETGTPRERAEMIRRHGNLKDETVCDLFDLSVEGLLAIRRGADWCEQYRKFAKAAE